MASTTNWYASTFRKLHLDYHQPPWMTGVAEAITPQEARRQARMFRDAGVQAVELFTYDHHGFCFFKSVDGKEYGRTHPGLAQSYTDHMVNAFRDEDIRTIAYINVYGNVHIREQHPEWLIRTADGQHPAAAWLQVGGSHVCASSPFIDEYFIPLMQHIIRRFDFDAIWLDGGTWLIETLCHCDNCRRQFRAATGYDVPTHEPARSSRPYDVISWVPYGPPVPQTYSLSDDANDHDEVWIAWRMWRMAQLVDYLRKVTRAAKEAKPSVLITDNNTGRWTRPHPLVEYGRFVRWLKPDELGLDFFSCDPVPFGDNHEIIFSREGRYQATTGIPFDYMNERFHKWGEWQMRSTTDFKLEFATLLSVSGTCFFADQPYPDGSLEPDVYPRLADAYTFVKQREPFAGGQMIPDVAILASGPSQIFGPYGSGGNSGRARYGPVGSGASGSRTDRVDGAHLSLVEQGIQCLIYDEPTLREHLVEQTAVVVPEQCLLEDATIDALTTYVENGGSLVVTGRAGRWDEQYRPRIHSHLYDLLGVQGDGDLPSPIHYVHLRAAFREGTALPDMPIQAWGCAVKVRLVAAEALADLIAPRPEVWRDGIQDEEHWQHYTVFDACPPGQDAVGPAITLRRVGKGNALYVAVDPFAAYRHEGHHLTRLMLTRLMDIAAPRSKRRISADKPLHVELSLQRQGDRLIVHLVNYFAQKRTTVLVHNEEVSPVRNIVLTVQVDHMPRRVSAQPDGIDLEWTCSGSVVIVHVPEVHLHTMIVIE
jgi:Hypothetical glycosyl hydrolase 6/Beta-galactosidase trimerisation domain